MELYMRSKVRLSRSMNVKFYRRMNVTHNNFRALINHSESNNKRLKK
jgi:hypothetical protein